MKTLRRKRVVARFLLRLMDALYPTQTYMFFCGALTPRICFLLGPTEITAEDCLWFIAFFVITQVVSDVYILILIVRKLLYADSVGKSRHLTGGGLRRL